MMIRLSLVGFGFVSRECTIKYSKLNSNQGLLNVDLIRFYRVCESECIMIKNKSALICNQ